MAIFCGGAEDGLGGRPLEDVGKKIFSLMLEAYDKIPEPQLDKDKEKRPLVYAVKNKLIN